MPRHTAGPHAPETSGAATSTCPSTPLPCRHPVTVPNPSNSISKRNRKILDPTTSPLPLHLPVVTSPPPSSSFPLHSASDQRAPNRRPPPDSPPPPRRILSLSGSKNLVVVGCVSMSGGRSAAREGEEAEEEEYGGGYVRMPQEPEGEAAAAGAGSFLRLPESAGAFDELPRARIVGVSRPDAGDITPMLLSYTVEVQYKQVRFLPPPPARVFVLGWGTGCAIRW